MSDNTETTSACSTTRRDFLKATAVAGGTALLGGLDVARFAHAAGTDEIRIALVGCGGRGGGAAANALGNKGFANVKLVAVADAFPESIDRMLPGLEKRFKEKVDVPPERRFVGLDAYEKAVACDVHAVLLCTPPGFRPMQFEAAVKAGRNVFMEKPVAVDAPGYRKVLAANQVAKQKNLCVAVGHHLRHSKNHRAVIDQIHDGLLGDLQYLRSYFNSQGIWNRPRLPGMTEMQYQVRNWYHFVWVCGDHIVEQHVHGIDVCNWLAQGHPVEANGMGGRQMRNPKTSEIYDNHFNEFTYANGVRMYSQCRQIAGCWDNFSHQAHGARGWASFDGNDRVTLALNGQAPKDLAGGPDGHQLEMDDFFAALAANKPYNEADWAADSTMTAILGRMASYSGKVVRWDDAVKSELDLMPERLAWDADPRTKPGPDGLYACAVPGVTKAW